MRNYHYRRNHKIKEQLRREFIHNNTGYFPTMPKQSIDSNGNKYYMEGTQSSFKQSLKRTSNRKVRIADVVNGGYYKKVYDLQWIWY